MKRALTAAVFGGLVLFAVPQAASGSARPVAPSDHNAEHGTAEHGSAEPGSDCAGQTEGASETEKAPAEPQRGDREQNDDDGATLF